ncbi:VOC family protein [Pleionea mediterranea]|uniref:Glyoxalase/fosfomycin resistance/dioxygenase domain-containing protein n=1 Tax=Pleionea mediterranea TaxID=523701 RepID=A0A316FWV4_9GAMM|nr:VOC family protein [Pleionea mediterranea]PWK53181.1 hypothetical protein C8D97_1034 [Pleionea mediterranea]
MKTRDIRPFIPVKNLTLSKSFYEALGFKSNDSTSELTMISNDTCTFFLYPSDNANQENNFMFQLSVPNIEDTLRSIENVESLNIKYEPIKEERWGKVIYMWGPSGEMWHITELNC